MIKARFFRYAAITFAVGGLAFLAFMYWKLFDGNIMNAVHNITSVILIVVTFLPAAVFAYKAQKLEEKLISVLYVDEAGSANNNKDK